MERLTGSVSITTWVGGVTAHLSLSHFCSLRPSEAQNDGRCYDTVCTSGVRGRNENIIHCEKE